MPVTVELSRAQCATLLQLINSVQGMENARALLPIYDAIKNASEPPPNPISMQFGD